MTTTNQSSQGDTLEHTTTDRPGATIESGRLPHLAAHRFIADGGLETITATTMNYVDEAIGIAQSADAAGIPAVISFTTETDGCLPTGQALGDAIDQTDQATDGSPAYHMINCAHPSHFADAVRSDGQYWTA